MRLTYDDEGNITRRELIGGSSYTEYAWDHRNRLIQVNQGDGENIENTINYKYDAFNQLIGRTIITVTEAEPEPTDETDQTIFVYDNGQVVLQFDKADTGALDAEDLSHRYLWGPAVDQLLADENVAEDETLWALSDRQGSITDMVDSAGVERLHRVFDSYGNIVSELHFDDVGEPVALEETGYLDEAFAYTGRLFDTVTGLQNNLNRWYDAKIGRWMSEDPIGFSAGDANLYRYVGNSPLNGVDPSGLAPLVDKGRQGGFWDSVADSWHSMQDTYTMIILDHWGYEKEAQEYRDRSNKTGPLGQTKDAPPVIKYGTRVAVEVSAAATVIIAGRGVVAVARGEEIMLSRGSNVRIAPFGNRTGHPKGQYPHYHRSVPDPANPGNSLPGQGMRWHRPWESGW